MTARLQTLCSRYLLPLRLTAAMLASLSFTSAASADDERAPPQLATAETAAPIGASGLLEERSFIAVRIAGETYHLEMLVVKPARAEGRLPVALIAHGKPPGFAMPLLRPDDYLPQARDLAYRGYLSAVVIRRGYGRSDGTPGVASLTPYARCETPDLTKAFNAEADDLEQALRVIAERPDADGDHVIAIGESVGGASVLALAARQPKGLIAVVNISGGVQNYLPNGRKCMGTEAMLPPMIAFGKDTKVPTLWVYAENDSLFAPELVRDMRNAFAEAGGRVKLLMLGAMEPDGHALFAVPVGRLQWLTALDNFLRSEAMMTWDFKRAMVPTKAAGGGMYRMSVTMQYFSSFTPKALVVDPVRGVIIWKSHADDLAAARDSALEDCHDAGGVLCMVMMENFEFVANPGPTVAVKTPSAD